METVLAPSRMVYIHKPEPDGEDRSRPRRPWVVPPPATWTAREMEGIRLLDEHPAHLAVSLFQALRDVHLWATCPPKQRTGLFTEQAEAREVVPWYGASAIEELAAAQDLFVSLVLAPDAIKESEVVRACTTVARWAYSRGHAATESGFFVLAALLRPEDAELAFAAGRAARREGRYEHAEEWFRRTVGLARKSGDDAMYASAYIGWGVLDQVRGQPARARQRFLRAWRAARGGGLRMFAAAARHYMISLSVRTGTFEEGIRHAVAAYKLYHRGDHRLPALASDTGAFLADHGYFSTAIPLFEAALPFLASTPERVVVLCNLARAVAALGRRERFLELWKQIYPVPAEHTEGLADSLIELAQGAINLGQLRRAEMVLSDALDVARAMKDLPAVEKAERMQARLHACPTIDKDHSPPADVHRFATRFAKRLQRMSAPS